jgi:hypothetical protein
MRMMPNLAISSFLIIELDERNWLAIVIMIAMLQVSQHLLGFTPAHFPCEYYS